MSDDRHRSRRTKRTGPLVEAREMSFMTDPLFWATAGLLAACIVLGGASRQNELNTALLELAAAPVLVAAMVRCTITPSARPSWWVLAIMVGMVLIPLIQLIPLPFEVWRDLPGRAVVAQTLEAAGAGGGWRAISLTPVATHSAILFLLPPIAVFFGVSGLTPSAHRALASLVVVLAVLSLVIGGLQVTGGPQSPAYFYETTNRGAAVGFFSNRNHHATFLLSALVLSSVWIGALARRSHTSRAMLAGLTVMALVVLGIAIIKSRAGVLLLGPALVAAGIIISQSLPPGNGRRRLLIVGGTALVVATVIGQLTLDAVIQRFQDRAEFDDLRFLIVPDLIAAAQTYFPFGSGIGSFVPVYESIEDLALVGPAFVNQAHDDYLQLWLEGGLTALIVIVAVLTWWSFAAWGAWRTRQLDPTLKQAASVVLLLIAIHSVVDYPMRTLAIAAVSAFACACLTTGKYRRIQKAGRT